MSDIKLKIYKDLYFKIIILNKNYKKEIGDPVPITKNFENNLLISNKLF